MCIRHWIGIERRPAPHGNPAGPSAQLPLDTISSLSFTMTAAQLGGATLQRCQLTLVEGGSGSTATKDVPASRGGSSRKQLSIEGDYLSVPSLQALLDAALSPGPPLHALVLFHGTVESAATAGTSSLTGLHTLTLQQIRKPADGSLAALLSVAPQLRNLQLRWLDYESRQDSRQDSMTALTSLTRLERKADNNGVSWDLPAGPYLTGEL